MQRNDFEGTFVPKGVTLRQLLDAHADLVPLKVDGLLFVFEIIVGKLAQKSRDVLSCLFGVGGNLKVLQTEHENAIERIEADLEFAVGLVGAFRAKFYHVGEHFIVHFLVIREFL